MSTIDKPAVEKSTWLAQLQQHRAMRREAAEHSGEELWKGRLPVGAEATPMTYVSPKSGRQYLVVSAGGNSATMQKGDYVVAYALPQ
nr:hypothetical protein [Pseudomonas moraviensis]